MPRLTVLTLAAVVSLAACTGAPTPERKPATDTVASRAASLAAAPAGAKSDSNLAPDVLAEGDSLAPAMPRTFHDMCQGEDCETAFSAFACTPLTLRADTIATATVVAHVRAHDSVEVTHRDLHLAAPGIVRIRRTFRLDWDLDSEGDRAPRRAAVSFSAGDTLYLLHYLELGRWQWWHRGRVSSSGEFWDGALNAMNGGSVVTDSSVAEVLSRPRHDEWWRVELSKSRGGWWLAGSAGEKAISTHDMERWGDACNAAR